MAGGDFLAKIKLALEGKEQVVSGLQQTQQAAQQLAKTKITTIFDKEGVVTGKKIEETFKNIGTSTGQTVQKLGDFEKALSRVIIVAPIWMAFRATIQAVTSTISEGFQTWISFDQQLIKSKAVIHDFSGTTDEAMVQLEDTIRNFSKESGISLDQLASSFYRFGTVGIAFSDALSGAIASAKLAKATLGDVDTISRSLAMTYRLLGDTIDSSLSPMAKQESLAGKILHLWRTNAFEANEFASSLNNFVSTANIVNFTTDQTIALLASLGTAGVQGARGGTLLKTAIQKLVENLDDLAPKLGVAVNPELENTFDVFMRVLEAINKLSQTKGIPAEALESIRDIFGGVRGGQVISALNALLPELKKNLEDLGRDPQEFIKGLNDRFKEVTDEVSGQIEIFRRMKEQVGEAFVKGILGAEDFKNALEKINDFLTEMVPLSEKIGNSIFTAFHPLEAARISAEKNQKEWEDLRKKVKDAKDGILSYKETLQVIQDLWGNQITAGRDWNETIESLQKIAYNISKSEKVQEKLNKDIDYYEKIVHEAGESQTDVHKNLLNQIDLQTKSAKEGLAIIELQNKKYNESDIALVKLIQEIDKMVELYNGLDKVIDGTLPKLDKQSILTDVLNRNWEAILKTAKGNVVVVKELADLAKLRDKLESAVLQQQLKQNEAIISHELEILKIRGASSAQLFEVENSLKMQLYGEDAAKEIGKLLTGQWTYQQFKNLRRYPTQEAFTEFFGQRETEFEAAQFFGLIPGIGAPRGRRIPIPETQQLDINMEELRKKFNMNMLAAATRPVSIQSLQVNVSSTKDESKTKEEQSSQLQTDIAEAIRTDPKVKQAIDEVIEGF